MGIFKQIALILFMLLVVVVVWVVVTLYLTQSTVKIEDRYLGVDIDYETTLEDKDMSLAEISEIISVYTEPIEPNFNIRGMENLWERIDENLLVDPQIFHDLQSDAVIEGRNEEQENEGLDDEYIVY